ncbi:hypothetical protein I6E61_06050 [Psychrobacter sp. NZS113]|uniref:hypothetical protein n=1 Tax=Psychrobacter sp. NZS113 TaxID=2792045 RepID=UPI0018CE0340|nr:hypothetical protein [Psychrobacter sp. NZS113]MBH0095950.1 hypothetical protein [Psychrobacter sp. NZS113]
MTNYIKIDIKPNHGSNYSYKHSNLSVYDMNLSFISSISSPINQMKDFASASITLGFLFSDVTPVITHFLTNCLKVIAPFSQMFAFASHGLNANSFSINSFTTDYKKRYYGVLSKNVSGQASRYLLAFFVPDNSPASQAVTIRSSTILRAHLSDSREYSLISKVNTSPTDYDGLTLQNKIAERRICRAVTNVTESKTRHPISLLYSVAFTQKTLGAIHHG